MSLFKYNNYERPFAGFGALAAYAPPPPSASQDSWIRRNWPLVLEILAYIFLGGAAIGRSRAKVDAQVPRDEIKQDDFEWMVQKAMQLDPTLSRAEVERRICEAFGNRIPACYANAIVSRRTTDTGKIPDWVIYAGLGLVGLMLLRK